MCSRVRIVNGCPYSPSIVIELRTACIVIYDLVDYHVLLVLIHAAILIVVEVVPFHVVLLIVLKVLWTSCALVVTLIVMRLAALRCVKVLHG